MNAAHLHLMLNHFPVVGLLFAVAVLAWGVRRKNASLGKAGLVTVVAAALTALPAFLTGEPAEKIAESLPGVSHAVVERHAEAAKPALAVTLVAGGAALAGLWLARGKAVASWLAVSVLLIAVAAAALMARTANRGGQIRHTEVRSPVPRITPHHD